MKIFGSISELVDLAFRLAGGKQVKLRSATQTTAGSTVTVNVPDVAATGDTQNMVLTAATQTLTNKSLTSPTISGGTINNSIIGGSTPAAGTFTAVVSGTLDVNTSAELQTLTIPSMSTAGILHNDSSGVVSSSLIINADVDAAAAIAFSKLATLASGNILVGSNTGVPTSRAMSGDVTIDNLGATTIGASKVTDGMLAGNISRSKLATGNNYRILANDASGALSENAALTANEAVATDANGQLVSVTGVSATELGYLSGVTSDIQTQLGNKASSGANSDITSLSALSTPLSGAQGGTGVNNGTKTITLGGNLITSGNYTTTITSTNTTNVTLPTSGTLVTNSSADTLSNKSFPDNSTAIVDSTDVTKRMLFDIGGNTSTATTLATTQTANRLVVFPDASGTVAYTNNKLSTFASTSSSELAGVISDETGSGSLVFGTSPSITTPTLDNPTIDNGATLLHETTPATPSSGRVRLYPKSDNKLYVLDSSGTETVVGSGSGSGEINAVLNSSGASGSTGWTNVTVVNSGSPLDPVVSTAFSIANTAASESSTSGGYYSISSMPSSLRSRKLKLEFYFSTPATDVYRVSVYAGSTRLALSSDSSGATTLPANVTGGFFSASFDSTTATAYSVNITRTSGSTGAITVTNVVVGPGIVAQGAAISEWQSFTLSAALTNEGTLGNTTAFYRRNGSDMDIIFSTDMTSNPAGTVIFTPPVGTLDTAKLSTAASSLNSLGTCWATDTGVSPYLGQVIYQNAASATGVIFRFATGALGAGVPFTWGATDNFTAKFTIPIAEWAGNGTVNLGQGAQVEYVADNGSADVLGPAGVAVPNVAGSTGTTVRDVVFQYPKQDDDLIVVELNVGGNGWNQASQIYPFITGTSSFVFGVQGYWLNATTFRVIFGNGGGITDLGLGAAGNAPWSTNFTNGMRWRVRKARASAPVGFGLAGTDGSSGLYQAGKAPGLLTGATIPASIVGETGDGIESSLTNFPGTGAWKQAFAVTLQPGKYRLDAYAYLNLNGATVTGFAACINTTTATASGLTFPRYYSTGSTTEGSQCVVTREINISVATTYYINVQADYSVATPRYRAYYHWTRIA